MTNPSSSPSTDPESSPDGSVASPNSVPLWVYYPLFFVSGVPALLYQIVWQRALFTIYGVNVESVTIIVTVFMLGLGLGSLAGGRLSTRPNLPLLRTFAIIEIAIGAFGAVSLQIFDHVSAGTAGASIAATGVITFLLLLIPTVLMGSTLPLLVSHFVRQTRNVGESVGALYSVNTLGSSAACFAAAFIVMREMGESGAARLAALLNLAVGVSALLLQSRSVPETNLLERAPSAEGPHRRATIRLGVGMFLCAAVGFVSLAYEMIWYRLYSFASGGVAPGFAKLLAFYLLGIAWGSFSVRDLCRSKMLSSLSATLEAASTVVVLGSIAGFLLGPALGLSVGFVPYDLTFPLVAIAAALLGAAFPILSHAAIDPSQEAGRRISYLYLSNIFGAALGSFLVGFVIMDKWSTRDTSATLLALGISISVLLLLLAKPAQLKRVIIFGLSVSVCLFLLSGPLYSHIFERLLFKGEYSNQKPFKDLIENRNGVVAVSQDDVVFGGGVYDGRFSTDLVHDSNGIFRAYAIAGLHPKPKNVMVIGLSSGSWAQVLVSHPEVEKMTVVEINPSYLELIRTRPVVSSLLRNAKVDIVIDDARRWLVANPNRKFDLILMNMTYNWRAHASNLLSTDFLKVVRTHLNDGGIEYYNTTWSGDVQATGAKAFPYALRVANFLAVSDSPISLQRSLWERVLTEYRIDGKRVFDLELESHRARLNEVLNLPDVSREEKGTPGMSTESRDSMLLRLQGKRLVTDDNMGTEWN